MTGQAQGRFGSWLWLRWVVVFGTLLKPCLGQNLVLQFDDGFENWVEVIAPELAAVQGKATGFVNNQVLENQRLSTNSLLRLHREFDWEIGTHTYHHKHAPHYAELKGLKVWLENELNASLESFKTMGLDVQALVFPYNAYTPLLARAVKDRVTSFRRGDRLGLFREPAEDGSYPALSIDVANYVPLRHLKRLIDQAASSGKTLALYGHRVLPDEQFITGTVVRASGAEVELSCEVVLDEKEDYYFVPHRERRSVTPAPFKVHAAVGRTLKLKAGAASVKPGDPFLIGPSYGTRLSDFREILAYAAKRLAFKTTSEVVGR